MCACAQSNKTYHCLHMQCHKINIIAKVMRDLWVSDKRVRKWVLPRRSTDDDSDQEGVQVMGCGHFQKKYDKVQVLIQQIGCMDELLSGRYRKL